VIRQDFLQLTDNGLYCPYGDFYLDPQKPVAQAVISHAHADHAVRGNHTVFCTKATQQFMLYRYKKQAAQKFEIKDFGAVFSIKSVQIRFLPAGHMLGSAMVEMRYDGACYLYTGDYKLQSDSTCEPIELVKADVLITESTFANPNIKHPLVELEMKKLNQIESNIMLGGYALGKCQRLIKLLNEYCPDKKILVHQNILALNRLYEQMGVTIGNYQAYDRKLMKQQNKGLVYMVPPLVFNNYRRAVNVIRVFASGWERLQEKGSVALYISDHVDWDDILRTVEKVTPQEIWTLHGNGEHLKTYFENSIRVKLLNA